ncbi:peptidase domain-containing ABC transporter [Streptococcus pseudoporcinus]|uniref:Lantibiotic transport/processing ATP-binding protein n=1 Tax=Streptococcus pseudoporcinus TaxID=361101 RepID=A0A4U9XI95_9STRE|nr:peptidase domain-containing ABC transporter [Streptococcus pseudoporcinus]VTS12870.1 lantibiotic transport/processing ATP-binding protein [Streptococcus pseudoporcinus]VUC65872.1 lantibiotic transport/processing ATP-binding protein [Streptococcus pseudoporcinus]VUC96796.1 lantibiotic transport/processing ATP-binding protein [Streptococcus pseudoporcinus]VUC97187.1 lantibiotic transport/processing ATP-binding protein [Streptococcus pseudoporcinus]
MKKVKFIQQLSETGCGVASICMILNFYGCKIHVADLNKKFNIARDGVSVKDLLKVSREYGLNSKAIKLNDKKNLIQIQGLFPCICIKDNNHYIVLEKIKNNHVFYLDPEIGRIRLKIEEFNEIYSGVILSFTPNNTFRKIKQKNYIIKILKLGLLDKKIASIVVLISILIQLMTLFTPWFTKYIIDDVIGKEFIGNRWALFIYPFIFVLAYGLFSFARCVMIAFLEKKYISSLKKTIVQKIFKLPLKFFDVRPVGEIVSRINNIDALQQIITNIITSVFIDFLTIVIVSVAMFKSSKYLAFLVFVIGLLLCGVIYIFLRVVDKKNMDAIVNREKTHSYLIQLFSNVSAMKTIDGNQGITEKWNEYYNNQILSEYRREKTLGSYQSFMIAYRLFPTLVILLYGSNLINEKIMTIGEMMAFISLTNLFLNPLATIIQNIFDFQFSSKLIDRLTEIILEDEEIVNSGEYIKAIDSIEFKNVRFSYTGDFNENVIDGISFKLKKSERLSLVGKTGCGKTTIIKLLLSLYHKYEGDILINNKNIEQYNIESYRKLFGVVLQDQMFFNDTIRNNVDILKNHTDEEVILALKIASLDEDVKKMPFNIYTHIGDNGYNLSGGQRQRLAIARVLIQNPKLIILDEGTNQLDAITEDKIMRNLRDRNITLITITHRLSTITTSDQILFLNNGKIVDKGKHSDLQNRNNEYKKLFNKQ